MMIDCRGITIDMMFMILTLTLDNDNRRYRLAFSGTFYVMKAICNHGTICH